MFLVVLFRIKQDTYIKNNFIRETALSVHMTRENELHSLFHTIMTMNYDDDEKKKMRAAMMMMILELKVLEVSPSDEDELSDK